MKVWFRYHQSTGVIERMVQTENSLAAEKMTTGYSGKGIGKNNPELQYVANQGPIPRGWYYMGEDFTHPSKGEVVIPLIPHPENVMHDRDGFLMHGDSTKHPGEASEGCVIADKLTRMKLAAAPALYKWLEVV